MLVEFIAQPDRHIGEVLFKSFTGSSTPRRIVLVSAFASLQTIMRLKFLVQNILRKGCDARINLGVDMGGTSKEVLKEVATWGIPVTIVKNRKRGVTFHPKVYLVEWEDRAEILVGSSNLTDGGFFGNYEGNALVHYELPKEKSLYDEGCRQLQRFLMPSGDIAKELNESYLQKLLAQSDIPTEQEARDKSRREGLGSTGGGSGKDVYGIEDTPPPPPLSAEVLQALLAARETRLKKNRKPTKSAKKKKSKGGSGEPAEEAAATPEEPSAEEQIAPASFYMMLPTLQGKSGNIPGEARIPLAAIEMAQEFWGWPDKYVKKSGTRKKTSGGKERVYKDWKPTWKIWSASDPTKVQQIDVRMYLYENSSDFRFYARPLVNEDADLGDIVRITRVYDPPVEFECVLAKKGTPQYNKWLKFCTAETRGSKGRRFGFG